MLVVVVMVLVLCNGDKGGGIWARDIDSGWKYIRIVIMYCIQIVQSYLKLWLYVMQANFVWQAKAKKEMSLLVLSCIED